MPFKALIFSIFILLSYSTTLQSQDRRSIDSLKNLAREKNGYEKAKIYLSLSGQYTSTSEDSSLMYAHQALGIYRQGKDETHIGEAYLALAHIYSVYSIQHDSIFFYSQLAREIFERQGNKAKIAESFTVISFSYLMLGNNVQALRYIDSAKLVYRSINDTAGYLRILERCVEMELNAKKMDRAAESIKEIKFLLYHFAMHELEKANILLTIAGYYIETGENDSAVYYLKITLPMYKDKRFISYVYSNLGEAYSAMHKFDLALEAANKGLKIAVENRFPKEWQDNMQVLYAIYKAKGDFKSALKYYEELTVFRDSISVEQKTNVDQVNRQLALEKDTEKIHLLEKDSELQEQEVSRQKLLRNGFLAGFSVVLIFAILFLYQRNAISKEKRRSDNLLLNILPAETAKELKDTGSSRARDFDEVTVMFTDFKNFSVMSEKMNAQELVNEINTCYSAFDTIITKYGIEKIKTIGDSYMCAGGLPVANTTNAVDTVNAALEIRDFITAEKEKREAEGRPFFEIRIGCHTGPVVAGIVGVKKFAYDIWGDTVNIASRMESGGEPGRVNISANTCELVKNSFHCTHRGKILAKNKGEVDMYFAEKKD
jgi:adenylate cyclase